MLWEDAGMQRYYTALMLASPSLTCALYLHGNLLDIALQSATQNPGFAVHCCIIFAKDV